MPPEVEHTRGLKIACSISQTRSLYARRFAPSCWRYGFDRFEGAEGLNMRTLKKEDWNRQSQKPEAFISNRAPSSRLKVRRESDSTLKGWREGSLETSWLTSDISSAVKSLVSLCLMVGKAPLGQLSDKESGDCSVQFWWDEYGSIFSAFQLIPTIFTRC